MTRLKPVTKRRTCRISPTTSPKGTLWSSGSLAFERVLTGRAIRVPNSAVCWPLRPKELCSCRRISGHEDGDVAMVQVIQTDAGEPDIVRGRP